LIASFKNEKQQLVAAIATSEARTSECGNGQNQSLQNLKIIADSEPRESKDCFSTRFETTSQRRGKVRVGWMPPPASFLGDCIGNLTLAPRRRGFLAPPGVGLRPVSLIYARARSVVLIQFRPSCLHILMRWVTSRVSSRRSSAAADDTTRAGSNTHSATTDTVAISGRGAWCTEEKAGMRGW